MDCCHSVILLSNVSYSAASKELNMHKIYKELSVSLTAVANFLGWWMLDCAAGACDAKVSDNRHLKGNFGLNIA